MRLPLLLLLVFIVSANTVVFAQVNEDSLRALDAQRLIAANYPSGQTTLPSRLTSQAIALEHYTDLSFIPARPQHFDEWVLSAMVSLAQHIDLGSPEAMRAFHDRAEQAQVLWSEKQDSEKSAIDYMLYGSLEGAFAQYHMDVLRKPLKAFTPAQRSAEAMRTALDMNPDLTGAKISLAFYEFWRSYALRGLAWTPFVADKRDESIATLYDIARGNSPYRVSAAIGLSWALIEMDRPLEAATLADSMAQALGQSPRGLLEPAGKAYYLAERWELARSRYDSLLTSLRSVSRMNPAREVGILHRLGHIAAAQEEWDDVIAYADDALSLPLDEDEMDRKQDDLKRLEKLRKKARQTLDR
ncbi:hypothetical protein KQI63_03695 [bacterium]|nr:hypothetical protein [bacterium]